MCHFQITQNSIATHLRHGKSCYTQFVGNFILFLAVKQNFENQDLIKLGKKTKGHLFMGHSVLGLDFIYLLRGVVVWLRNY